MDVISPDSTSRLLDVCADISGHGDFGLLLNERIDITMYGLFGYLLLNSGTVEDLFDTLEDYYRVHHDGGDYYKVSTQQHTVSIEYGFDHALRLCPRHSVEWALGFIPYHLQPALGELARPIVAQFSYDSPHELHRLRSYFGDQLEFNTTYNRLIYPRSIISKPIVDVDPQLLGVLRGRADVYLRDHLADNSLLKNIRMLMFEHLGDKEINASDIARSLNLSLSTFKRRLIEESIDFKETKNSIKNELAKQLLSKTDVKIADIAQKTGFSNQSSFTRFFIRCNRQTPHDYRKSKKLSGS